MVKNGLLIATLLLGCASQAAQAQIYELAFTDTNDATVVKSPSQAWYNPKGTITVTHIAGLDRKVKLELLQGATVVSTQTSALLTVANRITASDGQAQSRGNQSGYITLRSDSAFAVIFNGLLVQPGETKDVVIPLDATGQASLPIYPATSGVAGKSSYMIDIPQLTVN